MSTSASAAPGPSPDRPPSPDLPPEPGLETGGPPPASSGTAFWDWLLSLRVPRSEERWLGGVCGGLAARTGVDPLLLRVGVVVLALLGGAGVALYAVAWLLLPDRSGRIEARALLAGEASGAATAALVLFVVAVVVPGPGTWWTGGPLVGGDDLVGALVLGSLALVLVVWLPRWLAGAGPRRRGARGGVGAAGATSVCRPSRRAPAGVSAGLTGLALLAGAGTWLLLHAGDVPSWRGELPAWLEGTSGQEAVAVSSAAATAVFGLGLVVLGLLGREDGPAGFLGTCAALLAVAAAVVPARAEVAVFGADDPWRPATAAAGERGFAQLAGESVLDLRRLDPPDGTTVRVPVRSGFGVVRVLAPDDVDVSLRGRLLAGEAWSDEHGGGGDGEGGVLVDAGLEAPAPRAGRGAVEVDVQGLFGQVVLEAADAR